MSLRRLLEEHKAYEANKRNVSESWTRQQDSTATHIFADSAAYRRIQEDLNNLLDVKGKVQYSDEYPFELKVEVTPSSGYWRGGLFRFLVLFSPEYPERGPTVHYLGPNRIFHPNIDGEESSKARWSVCLGVQTHWHRSFTINCIIHGIEQLFDAPSFDDHLYGVSALAAQVYNQDHELFAECVQCYMRGEYDKVNELL